MAVKKISDLPEVAQATTNDKIIINTPDGTGGYVTRQVPLTGFPSYVDDIIEGYYYNENFYDDAEHTIGIIPEEGKIYVDKETNHTYRWSGSIYVLVGGTDITVDDAISSTSENPVQNKVITQYLTPVLGTPADPSAVTYDFLFDKPTISYDPDTEMVLEYFAVSGTTPAFNQVQLVFSSAIHKTIFENSLQGIIRGAPGYSTYGGTGVSFAAANSVEDISVSYTLHSYNLSGTDSTSTGTKTWRKKAPDLTLLDGITGVVDYVQPLSPTMSYVTDTVYRYFSSSGWKAFTPYANTGNYTFTFNGSAPATPWEDLQERVIALESVTVDNAMSTTSTNAVQNKVITENIAPLLVPIVEGTTISMTTTDLLVPPGPVVKTLPKQIIANFKYGSNYYNLQIGYQILENDVDVSSSFTPKLMCCSGVVGFGLALKSNDNQSHSITWKLSAKIYNQSGSNSGVYYYSEDIRTGSGTIADNYNFTFGATWLARVNVSVAATQVAKDIVYSNVNYLIEYITNYTELTGYTFIYNGAVKTTSQFQDLQDRVTTLESYHEYSTTERVVGKWVDGKDVYEKTFYGNAITSSREEITHGISNLESVIEVNGSVGPNSNNGFMIITSGSSEIFVNATKIIILYSNSDYDGQPYQVTIRYTKSTATP